MYASIVFSVGRSVMRNRTFLYSISADSPSGFAGSAAPAAELPAAAGSSRRPVAAGAMVAMTARVEHIASNQGKKRESRSKGGIRNAVRRRGVNKNGSGMAG